MNIPEKKRQQKRGRERRAHILKAAREILDEKDLEEISLADVAARTGVPLSSLYHFYPSLQRLLAELIPQFAVEILGHLKEYFADVKTNRWLDDLDLVIEQSAVFYRDHPGYQQLILSGKAPEQIKRNDRRFDEVLVKGIAGVWMKKYDFPDVPNQDAVFSYALQIVELAFALSVMREGSISQHAIEEAKRAARAYLLTYVPEEVPTLEP